MRPAAQDKGGGAPRPASDMQAAPLHPAKGGYFPHHGIHPAAPQGGFHDLEGLGIVACLHKQEPRGIEAIGDQAKGVEIGAGADPEDGAGFLLGMLCHADEKMGGEGSLKGRHLGRDATGCDLVQGAKRQAASKMRIDLGDAQGQEHRRRGNGWER